MDGDFSGGVLAGEVGRERRDRVAESSSAPRSALHLYDAMVEFNSLITNSASPAGVNAKVTRASAGVATATPASCMVI